MSCNRDVPGDYELSEVIEAAGTDWYGVSEDEIGIFIDGPQSVLQRQPSRTRQRPGCNLASQWRDGPPIARRSLTGWSPCRANQHTRGGNHDDHHRTRQPDLLREVPKENGITEHRRSDHEERPVRETGGMPRVRHQEVSDRQIGQTTAPPPGAYPVRRKTN